MLKEVDIVMKLHLNVLLPKGWLRIDGDASWIKEIWHTGEYTDQMSKVKATSDSILGGWKVIMYNTENDKAVKIVCFRY